MTRVIYRGVRYIVVCYIKLPMYTQAMLCSRVELAIFYTLFLTYIKIEINRLKPVLINLEHCTIQHIFYCHTHDSSG